MREGPNREGAPVSLHEVLHASMWLSGTTLTVFGFTIPTGWNSAGAALNAVLAVLLGLYGWHRRATRTPAEKGT